MLNDVRDKYFNKITVQVDLERVHKDLISHFQSFGKTCPGNCTLNFDIVDTKENASLRLLSTKVKFSPQNEVLKWLDEEGFPYRLN